MGNEREIIGFEHDPACPWWYGVPYEWFTDAKTGRELFTRGGYPVRLMTDENRVEIWREFGFRPVYRE
jgi:hypothetical protein